MTAAGKNLMIVGAVGVGVFLLLKNRKAAAGAVQRDGVTVYDKAGGAYSLLMGKDGLIRDQKGNLWA